MSSAAWGVLSWATVYDGGERITSSCLVSGTIRDGASEIFNPLGNTFGYPSLGLITLTSIGIAVNLDEVMAAVKSAAIALERSLMKAFDMFPDRAGSDLLIHLDFVPAARASPDPIL